MVHLCLRPGPAAVPPDNLANVCQTDPDALELLVRMETLEHAEQLVPVPWVKSDTVVTDEDDPVVVQAHRPDLDPCRLSGSGELDRVRDEIDEGHPQHGPIARDDGQVPDRPARVAAGGVRLQFADDVSDQFAQVHVEPRHLPARHPGEA